MRLPVTIPLRPSVRLMLALALAHGAALAVIFPIFLPLPIKGLLAAAIAVSALLALRQARYPEMSALHLGKAGELTIETIVDARSTAIVLPQTTVLPGFVILLLQRENRSVQTLLLPTDTMDCNAHRQLRLWLRWKSAG